LFGLPLLADQLKMAIPLSQNNAPASVFGYLLSGPSAGANIVGFGTSPTARLVQPGTIEDQFLAKIQNLLYIAALVGLLGVIFALVIARTLIAPLNQLEQAARTFANRDWTYRIAHQGTHELAAVASAFNDMADQLERAESLRRNLVADIAHELRTPLSVMQANLMALLDGVYPLDKREIATLYEETCMLGRLVSDLRELAQADAGQLDLKPDRINVRMLIQNLSETFAATAETEGTHLFMLPCAEDWTIHADNGRVTQVLGNLVANALQHTPGGTVVLSAEKQEKGARQSPLIRINVTDNGSGISPADILHVFDRFYRADKSRTRAHGNSGLGLAIAKAWIEAMGGQINVESIHGKGSRFWFTLPMCK
jgi:two-component system, OmpR family, sensor kinase